MISYRPLLILLIDRKLKLSVVCREAGLSSKIAFKINNGENITLETIDKICNYLNVDIQDVVQIIRGKD
jgi:DNA-binding Xre family transcriptional regulator